MIMRNSVILVDQIDQDIRGRERAYQGHRRCDRCAAFVRSC